MSTDNKTQEPEHNAPHPPPTPTENDKQIGTKETETERIRLIAINIGSNNKNLQRVVDKYNGFDIIMISEAGAKNNNLWLESIEDYQLWIKPNTKKRAKDSMVMLISKDLEYETIKTPNPRSRSIRLMAAEEHSIDLHFIYGPPDSKDRKIYWDNWKNHLTKQDEGERNNIIMGDLNNVADAEKDRLNNENGNSYSLLELINEGGLVDAVQAKSPKHKFSWFRINKGKKNPVEASRIDHALVDETLMEFVERAYIEDPDANLSPDHATVVLELQIPKLKKIPNRSPRLEQKIEMIKTKILKAKGLEYKQKVETCVKNRKREDHGLKPAEKWNNLATELKAIAILLTGGTEKRVINGKKTKKINHKAEGLRKKLRRMSKALGSTLHLKKGDEPTKKIQALEANGEKYSLPLPEDGDWEKWRKQLNEMKNELTKELQTEENAEENKRIKELIGKLRASEKVNPKTFFHKLSLKNNNGNLYRVRTKDGDRIAEAEEVKREVSAHWEQVWRTKESKDTTNCDWFKTDAFQRVANNIKRQDNTNRPITAEEMLEVLECCGKTGKAPGADGIPYEIIFYAKEELAAYMAEIYQEFITPKIDDTFPNLPADWKLTKIFLIFKDGPGSSEENPLDYRPISLLCIPYKILMGLLERRIRKIHEPLFSETQGGFRADRPCCNKSLILANLIKDAKQNGKEIHIGFLDLKKAYDSVNPEDVTDTMRRMNYNSTIVSFLEHTSQNCRGTIITPHGDTPEFTFAGGLKQGDPISPLLFLLFLKPLLLQIEETRMGYTMTKKDINNQPITINNASFADDQALIGKSNQELQELFNMATRFYNYHEIELSLSSKYKTAYMTNKEDDNEQLLYNERDGAVLTVPKLEKEEAYKYLGVKLNAEASWRPLEATISSTIGLHLRNIRNRAITPFQKVLIVNKVLIPGIEYRLQIGEIKKSVLQSWNNRITRCLLRSCGWEYNDGFTKAFFPEHLGGLNLANLIDVDLQAKIQSVIILGINGVDNQTKRVIRASDTDSKGKNIMEVLSRKLHRLKLKIQEIQWKETKPGEISCHLNESTTQKLHRRCDTIEIAYPDGDKGLLCYIGMSLQTSINKQMKPIMEKSKSLIDKL